MSIQIIQSALEKRLETLSPVIATAYENASYTPVNGVPYQRVSMLVNNPVDYSVAMDIREDRGIFQVSLYYPQGAGRGAAQARAELVRQLFDAPLTITMSGVAVHVAQSPHVGSGMQDGDRWVLPVSIYWRSFRVV
jgi:hypothetical protein